MLNINDRRSTNVFNISGTDVEAIAAIASWAKEKFGKGAHIVALAHSEKTDGESNYVVRISYRDDGDEYVLADYLVTRNWRDEVVLLEESIISDANTRASLKAAIARMENGMADINVLCS